MARWFRGYWVDGSGPSHRPPRRLLIAEGAGGLDDHCVSARGSDSPWGSVRDGDSRMGRRAGQR
jgi:hypothetical protein